MLLAPPQTPPACFLMAVVIPAPISSPGRPGIGDSAVGAEFLEAVHERSGQRLRVGFYTVVSRMLPAHVETPAASPMEREIAAPDRPADPGRRPGSMNWRRVLHVDERSFLDLAGSALCIRPGKKALGVCVGAGVPV